jgi:hypothetical protein
MTSASSLGIDRHAAGTAKASFFASSTDCAWGLRLAVPADVRLARNHAVTLDVLRVALASGLGLSLATCGGHTTSAADRDPASKEVAPGVDAGAGCPYALPTNGTACSFAFACSYPTLSIPGCGAPNCSCQDAAWLCEMTCIEPPGFAPWDAAAYDAAAAAGDAATDAAMAIDSAHDAGSVACGSMTCEAGALCVFDQQEGGALRRPDDAGNCPDGQVLTGIGCSPAPSYHCFPKLAACSADARLSCSCAQSLCQTGYTCMSVTGAVIGCYQLVP